MNEVEFQSRLQSLCMTEPLEPAFREWKTNQERRKHLYGSVLHNGRHPLMLEYAMKHGCSNIVVPHHDHIPTTPFYVSVNVR